MTLKFIAALGMADQTANGRGLDVHHLESAALACRDAGFSGVYLPQASGSYEPMELAGYLATLDLNLDIWVGHRPAAVVPTMSSRMFATLDQLTGGRISAVLDLEEGDAQREGDSVQGPTVLARAYEYASIMGTLWGADTPQDHDGAFYRFNKARTVVQPLNKAAMPILAAVSVDQALSIDQSAFNAVLVAATSPTQMAAVQSKLRGSNTKGIVKVCLDGDDTRQIIATIQGYGAAGVDTIVLFSVRPIQDALARHPGVIALCAARP